MDNVRESITEDFLDEEILSFQAIVDVLEEKLIEAKHYFKE